MMKKTLVAVLLIGTVFLFARSGTPQNAFIPKEIKWGPAPPFVPAGAQLAVLEGNPMADSGDYTIRLKMPNAYKIAPHWHPKRENVTVISGSLKVGWGTNLRLPK